MVAKEIVEVQLIVKQAQEDKLNMLRDIDQLNSKVKMMDNFICNLEHIEGLLVRVDERNESVSIPKREE